MMKTIFALILCLLTSTCYSQIDKNFTLKAGRGYILDYTMYHALPDIKDNYPIELYKREPGNSLFFEVSYKMPNNYSIGLKLAKAELKNPYNDNYLPELLRDNYSLVSLDFYELMFGYDWQFGKHSITLNAGPVFNKYSDSYYSGVVINEQTDEYGTKIGTIILSQPIIQEREWWEFGLNPGISYEFFPTKSIGIGIKAEAYFLAYYGFSYLTISPTICIRV